MEDQHGSHDDSEQDAEFAAALAFSIEESSLSIYRASPSVSFTNMAIPVIPNKAILYLMYVAWSSVLTVPMLFPFVGYMTVDFGMAENTDSAGYYAGFLAGAFMFGRSLSSAPWGFVADRYGRMRVMQFCTLVSGCLTMYFGIAPNYTVAVIVRIATGFFNPIIALCKATLPELVPPEHMHAAMSIISIQWAFGLTTGPVLGGWLSRWCCGEHKYMLPCLLCGILQILGLYPISLVMKEVGTGSKNKISDIKSKGKHVRLANIISDSDDDDSNEDNEITDADILAQAVALSNKELEEGHSKSDLEIVRQHTSSGAGPQWLRSSTSDLYGDSRLELVTSPTFRNSSDGDSMLSSPQALGGIGDSPMVQPRVVGKQFALEVQSMPSLDSNKPTPESSGQDHEEGEHWCWGNYAMLSVLMIYLVISLFSITTEEVFSLWAVSSKQAGGLQVDPKFIGTIIACQGIFSMCFQLLIGPKVVAYWGLINSVQRGMILGALAIAPIPAVSDFVADGQDGENLQTGFLLAVLAGIRSAGFYLAFTCSFCLLNNSVPRTHLGRVNGIAMMFASISKFLGPALGSPVFAWSISGSHPFPFDRFFYFVLAGVALGFSGIVLPLRIPRRLENN